MWLSELVGVWRTSPNILISRSLEQESGSASVSGIGA